MNLKSALTALMAIFCCLSSLFAQSTAVEVPDSAAVVEETFVAKLQNPAAGVTVDAPYALWLRVNKVETAEAPLTELIADDADETQEGERSVQKGKSKGVGYRVQVFADNNARSAKSEARQREKAISSAFPDYGTYVTYASPFWRLRVGDFKSQYDAEKAAAEIKRQFPGYAREVRVVRDRVNTK